MGTTKLTRKEILAEDPVHEAIMQLIEFFRVNGTKIGIAAAAVVVLAFGIYAGRQYLDSRNIQAQGQLARGMDFFHGEVAPDATDDPYSKGSTPTFRSDAAKYQAAAKEFSSVLSGLSYSKVSIVGRYYLGLSQLKLGQKKEAIQNLETVAGNSKDRTLGDLAKQALATEYLDSGNFKGAQGTLENMISDPQCDLPKEELSLQLSQALVAMGKRDQAIKVLQDTGSKGSEFGILRQKVMEELDKLQKAAKTGSVVPPVHP